MVHWPKGRHTPSLKTLKSTFSKYSFGREEGDHKKCTRCTLLIMVTIILDDPSYTKEFIMFLQCYALIFDSHKNALIRFTSQFYRRKDEAKRQNINGD